MCILIYFHIHNRASWARMQQLLAVCGSQNQQRQDVTAQDQNSTKQSRPVNSKETPNSIKAAIVMSLSDRLQGLHVSCGPEWQPLVGVRVPECLERIRHAPVQLVIHLQFGQQSDLYHQAASS